MKIIAKSTKTAPPRNWALGRLCSYMKYIINSAINWNCLQGVRVALSIVNNVETICVVWRMCADCVQRLCASQDLGIYKDPGAYPQQIPGSDCRKHRADTGVGETGPATD